MVVRWPISFDDGHGFKWHGGGPEPISIMDGGGP